MVYSIRGIEYQHRGMPHAHIVVKFSNMPYHDDIEGKIDFIDEFISAKVPPDLNNFSTPDERRYNRYFHIHMVHHCAICANDCKKSATCKCKREYEDTIIGNTHFDERGFPVYERLRQEDLKIVPHNRAILMDWNGHCNVEFSAGVRCILYLYKYLYEGPKIYFLFKFKYCF